MIKTNKMLVSFDNIWNPCEVSTFNTNDSELIPEIREIAKVTISGKEETLRIRFNMHEFIESISERDKERLLEFMAEEIGFEKSMQLIEEYEGETIKERKVIPHSDFDALSRIEFWDRFYNTLEHDRYGNEIWNKEN